VKGGSLVLWVASRTNLSKNKAESRQQIKKTVDRRQQTADNKQQNHQLVIQMTDEAD
jgi:hypothetical protein